MSWLSKAFKSITGQSLSSVTAAVLPAAAPIIGNALVPGLGGVIGTAAGGILSKVASGGGGLQPPIVGAGMIPTGGSAMSLISAGGAIARRALPAVGGLARKVLPGAGAVATGAALAGAFTGGGAIRRRRGRGFSARDVRQTKRMMKMLKEVQGACPRPRTARTTGGCGCR